MSGEQIFALIDKVGLVCVVPVCVKVKKGPVGIKVRYICMYVQIPLPNPIAHHTLNTQHQNQTGGGRQGAGAAERGAGGVHGLQGRLRHLQVRQRMLACVYVDILYVCMYISCVCVYISVCGVTYRCITPPIHHPHTTP